MTVAWWWWKPNPIERGSETGEDVAAAGPTITGAGHQDAWTEIDAAVEGHPSRCAVPNAAQRACIEDPADFRSDMRRGTRVMDAHEAAGPGPDVRAAVLYLRASGFETMDVGDGAQAEWGREGAMDVPTVGIASKPQKLISDAIRLADLFRSNGIDVEIEATYFPKDGVAIIVAYGPELVNLGFHAEIHEFMVQASRSLADAQTIGRRINAPMGEAFAADRASVDDESMMKSRKMIERRRTWLCA